MRDVRRVLWEATSEAATTRCVTVSCCSGAELQIVRETHGDEEIVLRELYPDHSSLYERARELRRTEMGDWQIGRLAD